MTATQMTLDDPLPVRPWRYRALQAFWNDLRHRADFCADDLPGDPDDPNEVGPFLQSLARDGHIRVCGYRRSSQPSRRGSLLRVWTAK